jgi:hypothetical protein
MTPPNGHTSIRRREFFSGGTMEGYRDMALWRKLLLLVVAPFAFLGAVVGLAVVLLPIAVLNLLIFVFYWLRFLLFRIPMPPKMPPQGAVGGGGN